MKTAINVDAFHGLKDKVAPLCAMHKRQTYDAFVCLDEHGTCYFQLDPPWENGCSPEVWHGRTLCWELPAESPGSLLHSILLRKSTLKLLQRVHDGHEIVWDGNNHVGVLNKSAKKASEKLEEMFSDELSSDALLDAWDVDEWLWCSGQSLLENWPAGYTLAKAAQRIITDAREQRVYCGSLSEVKEALMQQLHLDIKESDYEPTIEQQAALDGQR